MPWGCTDLSNGKGWTAQASRDVQKHSGELMKFGYHLKDPNTTQRADALLRALRVYGPKNLDMKMGFLEGVFHNDSVLGPRAKMDAQFVHWLEGKNVPLPPGYPKVHRPNTKGSKYPREGYKAVLHRNPGEKHITVRVFTGTGHLLLEKPFYSPAEAARFKKRMEEA